MEDEETITYQYIEQWNNVGMNNKVMDRMDMNTMINLDCEFISKAVKASGEEEALEIIKEYASIGVPRAIYYYMGYCSKHEEL